MNAIRNYLAHPAAHKAVRTPLSHTQALRELHTEQDRLDQLIGADNGPGDSDPAERSVLFAGQSGSLEARWRWTGHSRSGQIWRDDEQVSQTRLQPFGMTRTQAEQVDGGVRVTTTVVDVCEPDYCYREEFLIAGQSLR